jgi:hypothetical protein
MTLPPVHKKIIHWGLGDEVTYEEVYIMAICVLDQWEEEAKDFAITHPPSIPCSLCKGGYEPFLINHEGVLRISHDVPRMLCAMRKRLKESGREPYGYIPDALTAKIWDKKAYHIELQEWENNWRNK